MWDMVVGHGRKFYAGIIGIKNIFREFSLPALGHRRNPAGVIAVLTVLSRSGSRGGTSGPRVSLQELPLRE
jgi:hypothetical protein